MLMHLITLVMGRSDVIEAYTGGKYDQAQSWEDHMKRPMKNSGVRFVKFGDDIGADMGHFYFKRSEMRISSDSYAEGWQKDGTHGFCQTFAACGFTGLGVPNFQVASGTAKQKMNAFVHNVKVALGVVRDNFVPHFFTKKFGAFSAAIDYMYHSSGGKLAFPYDQLSPKEIAEDLNCMLMQDDSFFKEFILKESTVGVPDNEGGDPSCPAL
jgi:hypothetical protein